MFILEVLIYTLVPSSAASGVAEHNALTRKSRRLMSANSCVDTFWVERRQPYPESLGDSSTSAGYNLLLTEIRREKALLDHSTPPNKAREMSVTREGTDDSDNTDEEGENWILWSLAIIVLGVLILINLDKFGKD